MHIVRQRFPAAPGDVALERAEDEIADKLRAAILGTPTSEPIYDPDTAAASSTVGWARQFAKGVAARIHVTKPEAPLDENMTTAQPRPYDDDNSLDVVERAVQAMQGKRRPTRLHMGVGFIQEAFHVPPLVLPDRRTERDFLLAAVTDVGPDIGSEVRSLQSTHVIAPLFQHWSAEDRGAFADRGDELIYTYLVSSLSPRLRPPEHTVTAVKKIVKSASSRPGWPSVSVRLVRSWIAEYFAAVTDYDGKSDMRAAESRRFEEAQGWPWAVERALTFSGNPLRAKSEADVDAKLLSFLQAASGAR